MAIVTDSLFDRQSLRIQEIINKSVTVFMAELDPVWRDIISTSQGVGNPNELGRDLKILKVFMGSFTGILEQGRTRLDADLYGDFTSGLGLLHTQGLLQTYPDPTTAPNSTPYRLAVSMRSMVANIMLTLGEKTAEATPALIGQIIAPKLLGFGRMMSHTIANYFYLSQNDDFRICGITEISGFTDVDGSGTSGWRFSFEPSNTATNRFARGMRVDIYDEASPAVDRLNDTVIGDSGQTITSRVQLLVESVDHLHNRVILVSETNPTTWVGAADTEAPADLDQVFYANSKIEGTTGTANAFTGIAGIRSWLKGGTNDPAETPSDPNANTTILLGTEADSTDFINVDLHPEFMSFEKAVNGVLTEHKLRQYLRRCHAAWKPMGHKLDCLIASDGVWLAYEAQKIGMQRLDRTGRTSSLQHEGSDEGFYFTFDGETYMGYTSGLVESQTLYGIKKGDNNWKRYVPPSPAGVQKNANTDSYVPFEFVAGAITGQGSNQLPIYLSDGGAVGLTPSLVTEGSQMPGRIRMQMIPENPSMMRLSGLTEDRVYAD